ncbi:MAG: helix-turn-helix transcriptional regulator [Terracidiphilus sp.]|jgi:transcriptional regulator with XRE-family HTH domain
MPAQARNIYNWIGDRIRELRTSWGGAGISQEELAEAIETTANTISRWETAIYKPSISDLDKLAKFFQVPIAAFFPDIHPSSQISALLTATRGLDKEDLEEVTLYALFRRAHRSRPRK